MNWIVRCLFVIISYILANVPVYAETCIASYYNIGEKSQPGNITASGIPLNDNYLTAAHKTLAFGTRVRVTNLKNGNSVKVLITDRGPYKKDRCIDVSLKTAKELGMIKAGIVPVSVEVIGEPEHKIEKIKIVKKKKFKKKKFKKKKRSKKSKLFF